MICCQNPVELRSNSSINVPGFYYKGKEQPSSSSCRAARTDIPDPFSPLLPIVHRLRQGSGLHPVSLHSCWMYVRAGRPAFARPYVGVHRSTSLISSSLLLQQCPACLVRLTWIVFVMGGRWPYIDRFSIIWKSDLTDKMKRSFFQAAVVSILMYGCTTWTLTKCLEKMLDSNYRRMLRAILNKSWRQHSTTNNKLL